VVFLLVLGAGVPPVDGFVVFFAVDFSILSKTGLIVESFPLA